MLESKKNSLNRNSILKLKDEIQSLFDKGKREYSDSLKVIWYYDTNTQEGNVKIFVSVPKRLINKAVHRNLIKRRIRESLRLNLSQLRDFCQENNISLKLGVVYSKQSIEQYDKIEEKIVVSLQKIYLKIYATIEKN